MPKYGIFLTRIFMFTDGIEDTVLIWKDTGKTKPVFWNDLRSVSFMTFFQWAKRHLQDV